ncbi:MAG: LysR substrate-binding domain-containing protein [Bordetella sp.]|nr:LysR substrate-binding domain-containing protein [Bordetella sp.]
MNGLLHFNLEQLRTFVEVVRQGTFRAAGRALGRSQAYVTQHMQRLEAQAGRALFQREGRGKQLTEPGRQLLRYAREILAINDDAMLSLRADSPSGSLRIGSPHDVADTLLVQLLGQLARLMPNLNLEVVVGRSPELLDGLRDAELDLTLATRELAGLTRVALRTSPMLWLCASQFQYLPGEPLPLILGDEGSVFRQVALQALDDAGLPWRQAYYSASPIGVKAAVRAGLGITPAF